MRTSICSQAFQSFSATGRRMAASSSPSIYPSQTSCARGSDSLAVKSQAAHCACTPPASAISRWPTARIAASRSRHVARSNASSESAANVTAPVPAPQSSTVWGARPLASSASPSAALAASTVAGIRDSA